MNKKLIGVLFAGLSLTLASCGGSSSNQSSNPTVDSDVVDPSTSDSEIREIYELYLANGGTLTYEECLATIKGEPGQDGLSLLTGTGAPSNSLGKVGDSYIDTASWDFYTKTAEGWVKVGNLKGQDVYHTVTFNLNGGVGETSQSVLHGEKIVKPDDPTRKGYEFTGWTYEGEPWVFFGYCVTEDLTLDANWDIITYSITTYVDGYVYYGYNPNYYTVEDEFPLAGEPYSKYGYSFVGWECNGEIINYIEKGTTGDLVLVATWKGNEYSVTFDKQGGEGGSDEVTATYDSSMPDASAPTKEGYNFLGYFDAYGTQYYDADMNSVYGWYNANNGVLYARWEPINYSITYVLNNEEAVNVGNPSTYTIEDNVTLRGLKATSAQHFVGWYSDAELENEVDGIEVGSIGDKVFYAKWEDHTLDEHCTCTVCGNEYHSFDENGVCTVCGEIEHTVDIWTGEIAEGFAGGTGTSSDPYIIESGSEFAYLSSLVSDGNALNDIYFELESDVDLNSIEWEPIGSDDSHPFSGVFDGNGHAITNMKVEGGFKGRVGLFGSLKDAVVKDLAIENASVSLDYYSESYFAGGIVAGTTYYANIINVYASGSLDVQLTSSTSAAFAGGIVGYAGNSYLTDCESDVTVRCITKTSNGWHAYSGGICGGLQGPCTFTNCFAKCNLYAESVSNRGYAGGIVGVSGASSTIQNCAVIGDIKSDSDGYVSGIYCYWNSSDISVYNSYYATTLSNGTVRTYGTAVDASCFTSLEWCIENLHWDFDEVWEMGETYPQLKTFKR